MKKLFFAAVLFTFAFTTFAQKQKSKDDLFKEIQALLATKKPDDAVKAYPLGKEFVERFGKDDKDEKVKGIKVFVTRFRERQCMIYLDGGKYAEGFKLCKEILAEQPENVEVTMNLAYAGYTALSSKGDKTYIDDSLGYARKTIQMMDTGSMPKSFVPFKDKDEAGAFMYFVVGNLSLDRDKKEAAFNLYRATLFESQIKNNSAAYYLIAACYEDIYAKMANDLKARMDAKKISDADFNTESARVAKVIDMMMDAYARAVKHAETDKNPDMAQWKQRLTQVYKFSKGSEAGMAEYIDHVNTIAMPDPSK